jgi:hypothetical protein
MQSGSGLLFESLKDHPQTLPAHGMRRMEGAAKKLPGPL